ncbi:MAG: hypothetical protein FWD78_01750 [Treponema sp.]|nr:hypothetical protein [Treponema sp.]
MNKNWLLDNADFPIKYILTKDKKYWENLLENNEVQYWITNIKQRSEYNEIGNIHGSHDYRMENILGKCSILGLSKEMPLFSEYIKFIINFLNKHIKKRQEESLSFGKIYSYRDYETVLSCFLPMLGFADEASIRYIVDKRIDILYSFVKQERYNIYVNASEYKGIKKEWQEYIIDPKLYSDGNIALPTIHDFILFAGIYKKLDEKSRSKVEKIVNWIFDDRYLNLINCRYGYFYVPGGSYNVKAIIFKINLLNFKQLTFENSDLGGLLFLCFILSHFKTAQKSEWFKLAMMYMDNFKTSEDHYIFPKHMILEKPDCYVIGGGHMNVGENKKSKKYSEIISTYWMNRIEENKN